MPRSEATVEQLLRLLPAVDELEVLRLRLIGAAVPDPARTWDSSSAYSTVDKRLLTAADVERSLSAAGAAVREYVNLLHEGLIPVFRSYFEDDPAAAASHLISLGERHEQTGRAKGALQSYEAALTLSLPLADKRPQMLALRRLGRVALSLGEFRDAIKYYERSAQLARDSADVHAQVVAQTGFGNVAMFQGRWDEAERTYLAALALAENMDGAAMVTERGQLFNNLGNICTRVGRFEEAEAWLSRALEVWKRVENPVDHVVCLLNLGHLREEQARLGDARGAYTTAIDLPAPASLKALVAADFADVCLAEGRVSEAEEMARVAEEHAISSGSPYTIGYMYKQRGNLARARGDEDGFTFFEKALQIAREKGYPTLEAETLLDYAELRRSAGGREEAEAYLDRARDVFQRIGAVVNLARAEAALGQLRAVPRQTGAAPAAAAGD